MASSRGLSLRSISAHRSLFNSALVNFSVAAGSCLRVYDHFLGIRRQSYSTYHNKFECGVSPDEFKNLKKKVSASPSHLLTANEFAAAIGFFPRYRELLWLQKISGTDVPLSDAMWMDTSMTISCKDRAFDAHMDLFKGARQYYTPCPGLQVYDENPFYDWMAASAEGIIEDRFDRFSYGYDTNYISAVLKIVCIYNFDLSLDTPSVEMSRARFPTEHKSEPWKRIPLYFIPQLQGIMDVMCIPKMGFYVWGLSGSSFFSIFYDEEYCDVLKTVLSDFWWKHVLPAKELFIKHKMDNPLHQLRALKPASRHELYHYIVHESRRIADQYKAIQIDANGNVFPPVN